MHQRKLKFRCSFVALENPSYKIKIGMAINEIDLFCKVQTQNIIIILCLCAALYDTSVEFLALCPCHITYILGRYSCMVHYEVGIQFLT